jgi:hypothetical protein
MANGAELLTRPGPDLDTAVLLAEASAAAYFDGSARDFVAANGLSAYTPFDSGNVQGYHCSTPQAALLVFRGTSNIGQWIRDARVLPKAFRDWGYAHFGFVAGIEGVERHLEAFDEIARTRPQHVWVAGHSLGGALAVLAAARMKSLGVCSPFIITYGQPAAGFGGFAERFDRELSGQLWHIVNQSDIVPRVPPFPYRQRGKHIAQPGVLEAPQVLQQDLGAPPPEARDASQAATLREIILGELPGLEGLQAPLSPDAPLGVTLETGAPAQLDAVEFGRLQLALGVDESAGLEGLALEGAIPYLEDHRIRHYVELLTDIRDIAIRS